jgi:hypothetical protein
MDHDAAAGHVAARPRLANQSCPGQARRSGWYFRDDRQTVTVASHVDIGAKRVVLNELAPRLDHIAHQLGEDVVGLVDLLDLHL